MKKILLLLTIILLSSSVIYANGSDIIDNGECGDEATWTLYEDGELIIKGSGDVEFSRNIDKYLNEIKTITIAEGIVSIEGPDLCENLTNIKFSDTVTKVSGFSYCGIKEIKFPITVKEVAYAFNYCENLQKIYLPKNMSYFSNSFIYSHNLEFVEWNGIEGCYDYGDSDESFSNAGTSGNGIKVHFGDSCEYVPSFLFSIGVKYRDKWDYVTPKITEVKFEKNIKEIGKSSFEMCEYINDFILPDGLLKIGEDAFSGCTNLKKIIIPDSVKELGDRAFSCNNMYELTTPIFSQFLIDNAKTLTVTNETEISTYSFYGMWDLENLSINAEKITVHSGFGEHFPNFKKFEVGYKIENIGNGMIGDITYLDELLIPFVGASRNAGGGPNGVFGYIFGNRHYTGDKYEANQYYSPTNSETYYIPTSLKKVCITDAKQIPYGAFSGCAGLEHIELNEGVTQIGQKAFSNCGFLSVKIPKSVVQIGTDAFEGTDVEKLYVYENSFAHKYAEENDFSYELIGKTSSDDKNEVEDEKSISVNGISLNKSAITLKVGESITLTPTILPSNATNKAVTWSTSKSSVATVKNGKITAVGSGETKITAKTEDGSYSSSCTVTVKDNEKAENNQIILKIGSKKATVFGKSKSNDVAPQIVNERTMLPARFVSENLGATVDWNADAPNMIVITKEDINIVIYTGLNYAYVNNKKVTLDSPAFIENDRTYTPVRFICESLGADVEWKQSTQEVIITK